MSAILAERLRAQAGFCRDLGSPLYAMLLTYAADDIEDGGPIASALEGRERSLSDEAPLGLMGAVHRLVLEGKMPELAGHYPSTGGSWSTDTWPVFREAVAAHLEQVRELVPRPIQTNEVGRSAALLGGFLVVAAETGLPLSLREIGASAGLLLRWDAYRYDAGTTAWGPADSPVRFVDPFRREETPPLEVQAAVADRRGCDFQPVDPTTDEGRLTLMSFVWADQVERFERLRGALEVARRIPAPVDEAGAIPWLQEQLAEPVPGAATVVYQSIIQLYLSEEEREELRALLEEHGASATEEAPLAWLRLEHRDTGDPDDPDDEGWERLGPPEVRLTLWPGGEERFLATAAAHGPPVRWIG